jgi:hypothetical protein
VDDDLWNYNTHPLYTDYDADLPGGLAPITSIIHLLALFPPLFVPLIILLMILLFALLRVFISLLLSLIYQFLSHQ